MTEEIDEEAIFTEDPGELNRLLPESESHKTEMVVINHTEPGNSSSSSPTENRKLWAAAQQTASAAAVAKSNSNSNNSSPSNSTHRLSNGPSNSNRQRGNVSDDDELDKISPSPDVPPSASAPAQDEEDQVDECSRLTGDPNLTSPHNVIEGEPKGGEYTKIIELLKEAEKQADPEYEEKGRQMEFMTKYNPRSPESGLNFVDYCCNIFQCCALCIEG